MSAFNQPYIPPPSCFGFCNSEVEETRTNASFLNHPADPSAECLDAEERSKKQELDNLLAEGMSGLTFQERQLNQEILHGVALPPKEDEETLNRALEQLDLHLLLTKEGSMYEVAEQVNPEYVHARRFRVMFLRANRYNPKASADQMLRFFESKGQLFGREKLVKDITIDDLDDDDIACLKSGALQLIGKDRSGRQVLLYVAGSVGGSSKKIQSDMRVQFFIVMKALQSEETQLRGTISIWYTIGDDGKCKSKDGRDYFEYFLAAMALPQKKAAIHLFVDEMHTAVLVHAVIKIMNGSMRARLRLHFGTPIECQYQLSTYGIPSQLLPTSANGRMSLDRHLQWVQSFTLDPTVGPTDLLIQPADSITVRPNDVLFTGRVSYSEGNQRYLGLIQDYSQAYDSTSLSSKRQVVDGIIHKIHESGSRFLRRKTGSNKIWEEVPLAELRKKVTQSFRNRRRWTRQSSNENASDHHIIETTIATEQPYADVPTSLNSNMKPNQNDVIFTGTTRCNLRLGNQRYLSLVQEFSQVYDCGTDESKREIVNSIIGKIHEAGGRFLKQANTNSGSICWTEVSREELRKKTMQAFRNRRRRRQQETNVSKSK